MTKIDSILNRGNIRFIALHGVVKHLAGWSRDTGINYKTLYSRLYQLNWKPHKALTQEVQARS